MKRKNSVAVAVLFVLLLPASSAFAELYKWADRSGQEFFTNDLSKVPQEFRSRASAMQTEDARVSVGGKPSAKPGPSVAMKEHRDQNGHGEEWWRRRAQNQRLELRKLEDDYRLLLKKEQEQDEASQTKLPRKKKKSAASHDRKKMQLEAKIDQARRRLEVDLPEEARKADAYPGWLRE